MRQRSDTRQNLKFFVQLVSAQFIAKIKVIRSNNGLESDMSNYYASRGTIHQTVSVETLWQNGIVGAKEASIHSQCSSRLEILSKITFEILANCVLTNVYLINRIYIPHISNKSSYELFLS